MPINGLTDRMRIPRLGKVRIGIKATNKDGKEYPKAIDYFRSEEPVFHEVYGEQPKAIDVAFPTDNVADWASTYYKVYSRSRGLVCRGDGHTATRTAFHGQREIAMGDSKAATQELEIDCPGQECPYYTKGQCKELMMLQFLMPKLPGLGIWQLDTSSINSILNINSTAELVKRLLGGIALRPLTLRIVPQEVTPQGVGKKTVYVLQLDIGVKLAELAAFKRPLMLPDPDDDAEEEYAADAPALPAAVDTETGEVLQEQTPAPEPPRAKRVTRTALIAQLAKAEQAFEAAGLAYTHTTAQIERMSDEDLADYIDELRERYANRGEAQVQESLV